MKNNMRIAINCRSFLNPQYTGIGRYTYHLVKSLSEIDQENQYFLYAKKSILNFNKQIPKIPAKNFFVKWDFLKKGIEETLGVVDIYHSPSPDTFSINHGAKIIVTVHDLIFKTFPRGHTQRTIEETEKQFQNFINRASKIICCSQNTAQDLQKYFRLPEDKVSIVYQGVDKNVFYMMGSEAEKQAEKVVRSKGVDDPYILFVGTIEPRKNLENILYAFEKVKASGNFKGKLAVIGMQGWMTEGVEVLVKKLELKNDVIFLGYLKDDELRCFYNRAEMLVFPSFYEGFGFPIVEAFSCGTPVITSNVSSCPEIAQDAALIINPCDFNQIADAICRMAGDKQLRENLRLKGLKRAGDFSFRKTAQETLKVYEEVFKK